MSNPLHSVKLLKFLLNFSQRGQSLKRADSGQGWRACKNAGSRRANTRAIDGIKAFDDLLGGQWAAINHQLTRPSAAPA